MGIILLIVLIFTLGALFVLPSLGGNVEEITQSLADIEQAQAMQLQAAATREAISVSNIQGMAILLLTIAVVSLGLYAISQNMRRKQLEVLLQLAQENKPQTTWAPGPNAGWKKLGDAAPAPALPQPTMQDMMGMMGMAMMTMMMRMMGGQDTQVQPPALPAGNRRVINAAPNEYETDLVVDYRQPGTRRQSGSAWEEMFQ